MKTHLVAAVFVIALTAGIAVDKAAFSQETVQPNKSAGVEVLDCRNQSSVCSTTHIEYRKVECEPWQPWSDYSSLDCGRSKDVEDVTLVTDPANYVTAERTESSYDVQKVTSTGSEPWDLTFLPNGGKVWTLMGGKVVHDDGENISRYSLDAIRYGEAGTMGVAADPDFEKNNYIYVYYTYRKTNRTATYQNNTILENRISRFVLTENGLENETVIKTVPGSKYHSGGRLEFGPDGKLYVTTGDADNLFEASTNVSYLGGKILRMNTDGSAPEDNPFDNVVYSMGHRNPQGIAWNPETGTLYNSEHGPWRHDEINRVEPGGNYGWGHYKCGKKTSLDADSSLDTYQQPVRCFNNWTMAPSGMTFVNDTSSPWHGDLFLAGLRGKQIYRAEVEDGKIVDEEVFYVSSDEEYISLRLRYVDYHDGSLYVVGDSRGIVKITP